MCIGLLLIPEPSHKYLRHGICLKGSTDYSKSDVKELSLLPIYNALHIINFIKNNLKKCILWCSGESPFKTEVNHRIFFFPFFLKLIITICNITSKYQQDGYKIFLQAPKFTLSKSHKK
jgi:hypothetical protein